MEENHEYNKIIRADFHMHGPIGFHPYWLKKQGYAGQNLLQLIAEESFAKKITICAITSHGNTEGKSSLEDRFGCLKHYEAPLLPKNYKAEQLGENILIVEKGQLRVYLVNGQTALPKEDGKKFDLLIVGSNEVPDGMPINDTLTYGHDHGLIMIAEHPFLESHRGIGRERLEKYVHRFDAIEGHNAQSIFPAIMSKLPFIGYFFSRAGRINNVKTKKFAIENGIQYLANSDAHRIEDLGIAYNQWNGTICDLSEEDFMAQLKDTIRNREIIKKEGYENPFSWLKWVYTFQKGLKELSPEHVKNWYVPSNRFEIED